MNSAADVNTVIPVVCPLHWFRTTLLLSSLQAYKLLFCHETAAFTQLLTVSEQLEWRVKEKGPKPSNSISGLQTCFTHFLSSFTNFSARSGSFMLVSLCPLDLIHCTNELNVSIPHLADTLLERTASNSWIVVFKALITTHHLMMYGNEVSKMHRSTSAQDIKSSFKHLKITAIQFVSTQLACF